jgi:hypothetical protein
MAKKNAVALRAARKARLASRTDDTAPATQSDSSITDDSQRTAAPAGPTTSEPQELTASVVDPSRLEETTKITLAGPYNAGEDSPHWVVLAEGKPLAEINLADQENPEKIKKAFVTDEYAQALVQNAKRMPIKQLLAAVRARPYVATVKSTEIFASIDKRYKQESHEAFQKKAAGYRDDLSSMMMIVAEGQRKNFIMESPLKEALFQQLKKAGVQNPVPAIEAAFKAAFPEHLESMLKQAQKWMDLSAEAMAEIRESIMDMPSREVAAIALPPGARVAATKGVPSSAGNVPLSTATAGGSPTERTAEAEKEDLKKTFSFRSRMHNHKMAARG